AATDSGVWPRALVLLCPAPSIDPWVVSDRRLPPARPCRLAFRQLWRFRGCADRLRFRATDCLSGLGRCRAIALSCVPLVCRGQTAPTRLVVELSLKRMGVRRCERRSANKRLKCSALLRSLFRMKIDWRGGCLLAAILVVF